MTIDIPSLALFFPVAFSKADKKYLGAIEREVRDYCQANDIHVEWISNWGKHAHPAKIIVCDNVGDQVILKTRFS
jgi:hypothetical protein